MCIGYTINILDVFQDYEFLDLSDVKEAELNKLQCALYERIPDNSASSLASGWSEPAIGKHKVYITYIYILFRILFINGKMIQ